MAGAIKIEISNHLKSKKILFVDDEEQLLRLSVMRFNKLGFDCKGANSGAAALEMVSKEKFDLVLSDIRMPNGDGVDLLKSLRRIHPDLPVVVLVTGYSDYSEEDVVSLGAKGLFNKPIDTAELIAFLEKTFAEDS